MQRQFDHNSDDFTLERIVEFGFDQFAEQIGDISGAATKELAIEQVHSFTVFLEMSTDTLHSCVHLCCWN